jgi:hypothetical protein
LECILFVVGDYFSKNVYFGTENIFANAVKPKLITWINYEGKGSEEAKS